MKRLLIIILCLLTTILAACSGQIETVDMFIESGPEAEIPKITKDVIVHTVVGKVQGEIIYENEADKWVRTKLATVSQHPFSLVENSLGKVFKGKLVGYDESAEVAYIHFKNSTKLEDEIEMIERETFEMPLTYKNRLQLKVKYVEEVSDGIASEKIIEYEDPLFKQNPDEIEAFVHDFEIALASFKKGDDTERFKSFIANDALVGAIEQLSDEAKEETYAKLHVKSINIGEFSTIAQAELALRDVPDSEFVNAIYSIIEIDGQLKIVNIQYAE